ncbi:MAG: FkbM family methyltransferase [Deltaproteobacteria bacterium]|nr:FkbM family methyltransferase [Deltaproteobacteria bacterium]
MATLRRVLFRSLQLALAPLPVRWFKKIPGVPTIYKAVYRRLKPEGETVVECLGHRLHVNAHDEGIARQILVKGIYEAAETRFFTRWLQPGMSVLDVGANFGYFTVLAARAVGDRGSVHAFEPEPGNFALLQRNVAEHGYRWAHPHRLALSDAPGRAELFTDPSNLGNPSLTEANVPEKGGSVDVELVTLDGFLGELGERRRVDLLKMDVQGFEGKVLAGAQRMLERDRPWMLLEIWPKGLRRAGTEPLDLLQGLSAMGYRLRELDEEGHPGRTLGVEELVARCDRMVDGEEFQNVLFEPVARGTA